MQPISSEQSINQRESRKIHMDETTAILKVNTCFQNMCQQIFNHYGSCTDCDHKICCTADAPVVFSYEIEKIARHIGMNVKKFKKKHILKLKMPVMNRKLKAPCTFLNNSGHCDIYDIRPRACQLFPFEVSITVGIIRMESIYLCPIATLINTEFCEFYDKYYHLVPRTEERERHSQKIIKASEKALEMIDKSGDFDESHVNDFMIASPLFWVCFYQHKIDGIKEIDKKFIEYLKDPQLVIEFVMSKFEG